MNPLFICSFRPRYLEVVLQWLIDHKVPRKYRVLVWDNGGAEPVCSRFAIACFSEKDPNSGQVRNLGKAMGIKNLVDADHRLSTATECYLCMDDDIIVDSSQLDLLCATALRPGMGMIGARYHPFNSPVPVGGARLFLDPCRHCAYEAAQPGPARCGYCQGAGKDPKGTCLRVYPKEYRTVQNLGIVAGGIFAISKETVSKLAWAPYIYPILYMNNDPHPVVYWPEDGILDNTLTDLGFINGYLDSPELISAIHLPELDAGYQGWKQQAKQGSFPSTSYHPVYEG